MNKKISFDASISETKNQFCPRMKIKKEGMQLLNDLMNSINSSLIQAFDQEYESAKKINTDTSLKCAQKAVTKVFVAEFRQLAVAQGTSQLMMYQQGELEYDFARSMKEIKSSQQPVKKLKPATVSPMLTKFTSAVGKVNEVFSSSDVRLDSKAKKLLGIYLYKLTTRIAARASENVPENYTLGYDHIVSVLPEFLSSTILQLAHSEGSRNMGLQVQGIDVFKPRKIKYLSSDIINDPVLKDDNGDTSEDTSFSLEPSVLKPGIKKLQPDISTKFDSSLALNVSQVANRLISEVKTQMGSMEQQDLQEVDFMHLAKAVQGLFPQNLLDHAALRARRMVEDYIKDVLKQIVKECESENTISVAVVRAKMEKYFQAELANHAKAAAARMLMVAQEDKGKNGKQTDGKEASSATKPKQRAEDTKKTSGEGEDTADPERESAGESSEEGGDADMETAAEESETEGAENEANDDDASNIKKEVKSQESTETVPKGVDEPDDDADDTE